MSTLKLAPVLLVGFAPNGAGSLMPDAGVQDPGRSQRVVLAACAEARSLREQRAIGAPDGGRTTAAATPRAPSTAHRVIQVLVLMIPTSPY